MAYKFGRNRPIAIGPRLSLKNYVKTAALPTPPQAITYGPKAARGLGKMYLNDRLGCCVESAMFHTVDVLEANAGRQSAFTDAQVEKLYEVTGYRPGRPQTDRGSDEQSMLALWQQSGLLADGSHKIAGWVAVNGADKTEVQTAIWLFENVMFGIELPDAYVNPFPGVDNFTWKNEGPPNPDQGHAFLGMGYAGPGVRVSTWGLRGLMTWDAVARYASTALSGEMYAIISKDALATVSGKAPNGFGLTELIADLKAIGATP